MCFIKASPSGVGAGRVKGGIVGTGSGVATTPCSCSRKLARVLAISIIACNGPISCRLGTRFEVNITFSLCTTFVANKGIMFGDVW